MGLFGDKDPWKKASPEQLKAEVARLQSQRKELETGNRGLGELKESLDSRIQALNKEIANKTQRLETIDTIVSTVALLQKDGIDVIYTNGRVLGGYLEGHYNGGSHGTLDNVITFGDGAAFVKYVKAHDGKFVLHGEMIYESIKIEKSEWDYTGMKSNEGLAFLETPHIQAYFIPDSDKKSDEEE